MIKFHLHHNPERIVWINTKLVTSIVEHQGQSIITFDSGNDVYVVESADEISKMWNYDQ